MNAGAIAGERITAIRLACQDVAAVADFYGSAFGCTISRSSPHVEMNLGEQIIELVATKSLPCSPAPGNSTAFQHFAIVVSDISKAMERLAEQNGWRAISSCGPQLLPRSSGGVTAFKFRDPEGHPLELLQFPLFPETSGWKECTSELFLGIDHSAITVADTSRSVAFYRNLGFSLLSQHLNHGIEQSRLDGLNDAVVEVTALAVPHKTNPHLELLCYRQPEVVHDLAKPDDTGCTRLVLGSAFQRPERSHGADSDTQTEKSIRDPDGHVLVFRNR